jgi:hypothetical protein
MRRIARQLRCMRRRMHVDLAASAGASNSKRSMQSS